MQHLIDLLQQLGFSEYETRAYVALLREHPQNGYALAKVTGIPRANVYAVLRRLEERGAIVAVTQSGGLRYSPLAPDDLMRLLGGHVNAVLAAAQRELQALATPVTLAYVQNVQGRDQLLEHAQDLISHVCARVLVALERPEAEALAEPLAKAAARGIILHTLCSQACPQECGDCRGHVYRYRVAPQQQARGLIVISDEQDMLMGSVSPHGIGIRTRQPGLIHQTANYLRHSITLAAMLTDAGGELENHLQPHTRDVLHTLGDGASWLDSFREWVEGASPAYWKPLDPPPQS